MRRSSRIIPMLVAAGTVLTAPAGAGEVLTNQLIVKFAPQAELTGLRESVRHERVSSLARRTGIQAGYGRAMTGRLHLLRLAQGMSSAGIRGAAASLAALPEVLYAEPDRVRRIRLMPNDPRFTEQWHHRSVLPTEYGANIEAAWDLTTGAPDLVIAILDSGMLTDHPEFEGRLVAGYDFITDPTTGNDGDGRDPDPFDPGDWTADGECEEGEEGEASSWHGTHVGGIAAATGNNEVGVAGVNWQSRILPVRVLGKCGSVDSDNIDAVAWAAGFAVPGVPDNPTPARVINMSFGGDGECPASWQVTLDRVWARGALPVTAAGNSSSTTPSAPGNCNNITNVAASGPSGDLSTYSDRHAMVDITAPGGDSDRGGETSQILSTIDSGRQGPEGRSYGWQEGTSQAAPVVAGVISLMLSVNPNLSADQVREILKRTSTPFPTQTCTTEICGAGIANAREAVAAAMAAGSNGGPY